MIKVMKLLVAALILWGGYVWFKSKSSLLYDASQKKRTALASAAQEAPVEIAALTWEGSTDFQDGVLMAVEEINEAGGILMHHEGKKSSRKIKVHMFDDSDPHAAKKVAKNENIVAVFDYKGSQRAIRDSITYERHGILYFTCVATHRNVTEHGFSYVFRTIPTDVQFSREIVKFALSFGLKNIVFLHGRSLYATGFAELFRQNVEDIFLEWKFDQKQNRLNIVFEKSYWSGEQDLREVISAFIKLDYDAIVIADYVTSASYLIKQIREMGSNKMIIGSETLDNTTVLKVAGDDANGTYMTSVYEPLFITEANQKAYAFIHRFEKRYGRPPSYWVSQAYEAVHILAQVYEKSGRSTPIVAVSTLKVYEGWKGLLGDYSFDIDGDIIGKKIFVKKIEDGIIKPVKIPAGDFALKISKNDGTIYDL